MRMLLLLWGCWREGERYYWGEREREKSGGTVEGRRANKATDKERKREVRGIARREYLRIAADIMLICKRGCIPDKPPVYCLGI